MTNQDGPAELVAELEEQERKLVLASFSYEDAWRLGSLFVDVARQRQLPVVIDIRYGKQQLFHAALAGSCADNDSWVDRKRRVAEHYGHSSYLVRNRFLARGSSFEESSKLDGQDYAAHGGAFPLRVGSAGTYHKRTTTPLSWRSWSTSSVPFPAKTGHSRLKQAIPG